MGCDGFPTKRLGPLCSKVGSGATPRGGSKVYLDKGEIALIRSQNVHNDGFNCEGLVYITAEHAEQLSNVTVESEDVLLNITGDSVARCCQIDPHILPARVNQHVSIIRSKPEKLVPRFLRYFLISPTMQAQMLSWAYAGATRKALTKSMIESFKIPTPDLPIQQRIAHILGTLDEKIELNRRMNLTLEEMAAAIFKSWFIDFDPVRAKAEGRDPGLPADIAALFPDSFENSELGEIPKGWRVKHLPDAIEVNPSRSLSRGMTAPYVAMKEMPTRLSRPTGWWRRKFGSGSKFQNGDVLLARITPCLENGKTTFVDFLDGKEVGWGSTEYIVLCSKPPLPSEFTYCLARSERLREHAISNMTGTSGRQRVPATCFDRFPVVAPDDDVAVVFGKLVQPAFRKTRANDIQSRILEKTRDALLPKLLSGELEAPAIGQAEEVEA